MAHKIPLVVAELGADANPFILHLYAALAKLQPAAATSGRFSLLGPDLHRLDRTSLRLAHLFDHLGST